MHRSAEVSWQTLTYAFIAICGAENVFSDPDNIRDYGKDETFGLHYQFDILIKPGSPEEIAQVLILCNKHKIPVTPRGGGSGVTGGALPVLGGVVLSLERLNRILEINALDGYAMAESGVVTRDFCMAVEDKGLYFPVSPSSSSFSFLGGNVAENAGSVYSCKYGTTIQYVMNLQVVLPTGEIMWTGSNVSKNATGLNLTQLFVGSEGTLGIITKVVYRLLGKPPVKELFMLAAFDDEKHAYQAILAIKRSGVRPSVLEWIGPQALRLTATYLNEPLPLVSNRIRSQLIIGFQYFDNTPEDDKELIAAIMAKYTTLDILISSSSSEKERLWKLRSNIGNAMTHGPLKYRDIDVCIPLSFLFQYVIEVEAICKRYAVDVIWFGHALDGNLHTMLLIKEANQRDLKPAIEEIYRYAIKYEGVISGEHGIGILQKEFMHLQFSEVHMGLMQKIKYLFDPNWILNPGKFFA